MIKKIALFAVAALLAVGASAQIKVNVGGGLALPMGDFGDGFKMGYGVNVGGKYMLNEKMAVGAGLGYFMFKPKEEAAGVDSKFTIMPISGNFTYYFSTEGFKPYAGADLGLYMWKSKTEGEVLGIPFEVELDGNDIGFAPMVGFEYGFSDKLALDVNAKYNYIMTEEEATSYVGINVGVSYSF